MLLHKRNGFNFWLLILAAIFFASTVLFVKPKVQNRADYIAPPLEIKYLNGGFQVQQADSFWLRVIQDFDHCSQPLNEHECRGKSWLFTVVNLIVELDNKFREAYYFGALALTILISDFEGASIIFDKAVRFFDKDWRMLYAAGYHAMFEEKNKLKASALYLSAADYGAPAWVRKMAGRLAAEGGDNQLANQILQQLIDFESDPRWINKLKKKIDESEKFKGNR